MEPLDIPVSRGAEIELSCGVSNRVLAWGVCRVRGVEGGFLAFWLSVCILQFGRGVAGLPKQ